ncbi:2',3'-cyclic-nucleotide 3'-phosphodiesterase isoform X2 [Hippoglossus hippoglossus]|uniref:2',3'-cyclic-nucleotide 3'-phosphodiesterase isoform X2 n=1 Tax=Hippoglossus hippoglossus TaxID=8267 RepID=UPI00148E7F9F|nr:2',3'-cyclic-nucleotide 3'-phosphodiesterase isoform X2 [Hippoglossus hippoglossus]
MDTERSCEVLDASPQQEEVVMEKEAVSKLEAPEESTEPEKSPAAAEEIEQLAVNGHGTEVVNLKPTEELIVTEPVTLSEQKADGDSSPKDARDPESAPVVEASPEPDESSGKISDPVAALDAEPENVEPVPENDPEPVPVQATLAESVPVPEPVTKSEPEAELEEQTLPEPVALQEPVDAPPPPAAEEQNLPEQVETKAELQAMDAGAQMAKEGKAENNAVAEPLNEVQEDKPAVTEKAVEMVSVTEVASEKPTLKEEDSAVVGNEKSAEDKKEAEPEKSESDTLKEVAAALVAEVVESELNNAELVKEEDTVPASGSLSFALLEQGQTKDALRTSRTLIVLRGLPGSGKSFLARAIADAYKGHCSVICADDHGVKPENPESSAGGYKALDEAVVSCCSAGTSSSVLVVVDDTNHSQDRLARMGEIAEEHHLVAIFLEPQTAWSSDLAQLMTKSSRGLEEAQLDAMKGPLEEMSIPLFFGFFLLSSIQDKIRCTSMDFLKTLDTLEPFKTHMTDFTGKPDKEVDLEQYFKATGYLHCTTKYSNYGKAEGAKEYAQKPAVKDLYGSTFELALSALFVTPRTVGARVSLTEEQLLLWPDDAEKEAESSVPAAAALPLGSRAHITLGCAEGVEAVQTGLDLLDILALQQEGQKSELVVEMELGSLTYYGEGRWLLLLREPICALACFSSSYKRKELESTKKEPEKKKKMKCTIL